MATRHQVKIVYGTDLPALQQELNDFLDTHRTITNVQISQSMYMIEDLNIGVMITILFQQETP